jgi:hypothetical protein
MSQDSYMPAGLEEWEEKHYPGEQHRHSVRQKGLGPRVHNRSWYDSVRETHHGPQYNGETRYWEGEKFIGSITKVRGTYPGYQIDDGQMFAHWGGPSGAMTYIEDRWYCGKEPAPVAIPDAVVALWLVAFIIAVVVVSYSVLTRGA